VVLDLNNGLDAPRDGHSTVTPFPNATRPLMLAAASLGSG
jgi:hypothetical protein